MPSLSSHLTLVHNEARLKSRTRRPSRRLMNMLADPRDMRVDISLDQGLSHLRGEVILRRFGRRNGPRVLILGEGARGRFVADDDTGWWSGLVSCGGAVDLNHFAIFCLDTTNALDHVILSASDRSLLVLAALQRLNLDPLNAVIACGEGCELALALAEEKIQIDRLCLVQAKLPARRLEDNAPIDTPATLVAFGEPTSAFLALQDLASRVRDPLASHALRSTQGDDAYLHARAELEPILKAFLSGLRP